MFQNCSHDQPVQQQTVGPLHAAVTSNEEWVHMPEVGIVRVRSHTLSLQFNATPIDIVPVRYSFYGLLSAVSVRDSRIVIVYLADFNAR
jgi:hypothetical protein